MMIYICPGTVFSYESNGGAYFMIRLTIFGNLRILDICIGFIHHFSVQIQW
jgi:hypothetical protein